MLKMLLVVRVLRLLLETGCLRLVCLGKYQRSNLRQTEGTDMAPKNEATSLLIVEEQDLLRQGLETIFKEELDFDVVGSMRDVAEAIEKVGNLKPQIVLLGLNKGENGGEVCANIVEHDPDAKILLLASPGSEQDVISAFKKGASGCLLTNVMADDLIQTIKMVAKGQMVVPQQMAKKGLVERRSRRRNLTNLSIRELEVLQLMANGLRNKDIADELCLSEVTIKTHVSRILRKLGKSNRTAAIMYAAHQGWIQLQA